MTLALIKAWRFARSSAEKPRLARALARSLDADEQVRALTIGWRLFVTAQQPPAVGLLIPVGSEDAEALARHLGRARRLGLQLEPPEPYHPSADARATFPMHQACAGAIARSEAPFADPAGWSLTAAGAFFSGAGLAWDDRREIAEAWAAFLLQQFDRTAAARISEAGTRAALERPDLAYRLACGSAIGEEPELRALATRAREAGWVARRFGLIPKAARARRLWWKEVFHRTFATFAAGPRFLVEEALAACAVLHGGVARAARPARSRSAAEALVAAREGALFGGADRLDATTLASLVDAGWAEPNPSAVAATFQVVGDELSLPPSVLPRSPDPSTAKWLDALLPEPTAPLLLWNWLTPGAVQGASAVGRAVDLVCPDRSVRATWEVNRAVAGLARTAAFRDSLRARYRLALVDLRPPGARGDELRLVARWLDRAGRAVVAFREDAGVRSQLKALAAARRDVVWIRARGHAVEAAAIGASGGRPGRLDERWCETPQAARRAVASLWKEGNP